jgi:hypothetical protein
MSLLLIIIITTFLPGVCVKFSPTGEHNIKVEAVLTRQTSLLC